MIPSAARLESSKTRFRSHSSARRMSLSLVGNWEWDFTTGLMTWSEGVYDVLGVRPGSAQPVYATLLGRLQPKDRARVENEACQLITRGKAIDIEFGVVRRGRLHSIAMRGEVYRDREGRPSWGSGTVVDITEIREAQRDLNLMEQRNQILADLNSLGGWSASRNGAILEAPFWTSFTGQTHEEAQGFGWLLAIHPDDVGEVASNWQEALRIGSRTEFSFRARHYSGEYQWVNSKAVPLKDMDGNVREWVGCLQDIQAGRAAEESRRVQDACLRLASEAAQLITWGYDLESGYSAQSEGAEKVLGTGSGLIEEIHDQIHPEDGPRVLSAIRRTREYGERCDQEFRIVDPDGQTKWLHVRADLLRDARVETGQVIGITQDVTAFKAAELRANEDSRKISQLGAKLNALAGLIGGITWTATGAGEMVEMPGWSEFTGQSAEDLKGWGWLAVIHPADRERVRQSVQDQIHTRAGASIEYRLRDIAGEYRWMRSRSAPVVEPDGLVIEWIGFSSVAALPGSEMVLDATKVEASPGDVDDLQLVSGAQVRAARGILCWGVRELAEASRVSASSIRRIEAEDGVPTSREVGILQALRATLLNAGVQIFWGPNSTAAVGLFVGRPADSTRNAKVPSGEFSDQASLGPVSV